MTTLGVVVTHKVHSARAAAETTDRVVRKLPIGAWTHDRPGGTCSHTIAAVDGALVEIDHDEQGDLITVQTAQRRQIKRARGADGKYHFTLVSTIACDHGEIELLVSPHAQRPGDHSRPDQLRLIPVGDDDFALLYGLRNDSESLNSNFKRTLLVDRATSLGWQRQLLQSLLVPLPAFAEQDRIAAKFFELLGALEVLMRRPAHRESVSASLAASVASSLAA